MFEEMRHNIVDKITNSIDDFVQSIVLLYQTAADCMKVRNRNNFKRKKEPWWDDLYKQIKKEKYKALRLNRQDIRLQNLNIKN